MSQSRLILSLNQSCEEALCWIDDRLKTAGLLPLRTFDMKMADKGHAECTCPYHGTAECNCQIVVLLVYRGKRLKNLGEIPVSLMVHGHDDQTWLYIVDSPQQRPDARLEASLRQTLIPVLPDHGAPGLSPAV